MKEYRTIIFFLDPGYKLVAISFQSAALVFGSCMGAEKEAEEEEEEVELVEEEEEEEEEELLGKTELAPASGS